MASVAKFIPDPFDLEEEIKLRDDLVELNRRDRYVAARRIQAWIRGILTRKHFRLLHKSATTIQRHWRGYRTRANVDLYLVQYVHEMWQNYYDRMATKIQAMWRGYWIRKTVLDIPKMRHWLQNVNAKNEEMVENMKKFREDVIKYNKEVTEYESMQLTLFILFKLHHLLRTQKRPGVITRIDSTRFTFIEEMLRCFEYRRYDKTKRKSCTDCQIDPKPSLRLSGTYYERCEREIREIERRIKVGITPLYRSEPYEEGDIHRRQLNQRNLEASIHNKYVTNAKEQRERNICIVENNDLYNDVKKMDCHLSKICLKCPIHDRSSS